MVSGGNIVDNVVMFNREDGNADDLVITFHKRREGLPIKVEFDVNNLYIDEVGDILDAR